MFLLVFEVGVYVKMATLTGNIPSERAGVKTVLLTTNNLAELNEEEQRKHNLAGKQTYSTTYLCFFK